AALRGDAHAAGAFDGAGEADPTAHAVLAGHSVGEFTATALAGVLTEDEALRLVATRGRAMAEASAVTPTGMAAVLGGDADEVLAAIERHGLTPANVNGAGQVVAAGTLEQIEAFRADPPAKARVIPLQVAGAFHTRHMGPAVEALTAAAAGLSPADPDRLLLSNADGRSVTTGPEVLSRLVAQVSNPVRWDLCMETLTDLGVTGLLELAPAGTLVGLAKRAMKGVESVALKTPDDLEAARALVRAHATPAGSPSASPSPREGTS
ncbi:MAG: (Acyl-carrier-protein) S-malonyltransferase, partial [Humibacillus sp.]|nr:(Acyl-carrier-protein) S-malonyltransferase [Humibacillus sp.]